LVLLGFHSPFEALVSCLPELIGGCLTVQIRGQIH